AFKTALTALTTVFNVVKTAVTAFTAVFRVLSLVLTASPIGIVVSLLGVLVSALTLAYQHSETFRAIVDAAVTAVLAAGQALINGIVAAFNWFTTLPGLAAEWMAGFLASIVSGGQQVLAWFGRLPGLILSALGNVGTFLYNSGVALIQGFWNGLKAVWDRVVSWVKSAMAWLRGFWPFSPAKRGAFSGTGYLTYSGRAMMEDWGKAIQKGGVRVGHVAGQVMDNVRGIFEEPIGENFAPDIDRVARSMPSGMQAEVSGLVSSDDFGFNTDDVADA